MRAWVLLGLSVGACLVQVEKQEGRKAFCFFALHGSFAGEFIYPIATVATELIVVLQSSNMNWRPGTLQDFSRSLAPAWVHWHIPLHVLIPLPCSQLLWCEIAIAGLLWPYLIYSLYIQPVGCFSRDSGLAHGYVSTCQPLTATKCKWSQHPLQHFPLCWGWEIPRQVF